MSRTRLIVPAIAALFALSAFTSTSPAMAQWMVNKVTLSGTETAALATTAAVDEPFLLKAAGVSITCTGSTVNSISDQIEASGEKGSASSVIFRECSANSNCAVTKSIGTVPVHKVVQLLSLLHIDITLLPRTKNVLDTISFQGETCALLGVQPITGKVKLSGPTGQTENTLQEFEAVTTEASGELKVGSSPAELKGNALLKLASGRPWSFL